MRFCRNLVANSLTMRVLFLVLGLIFTVFRLNAQPYTSYFTGNTTNIQTVPSGGVCMMGGASEHDEAMKWFLQRAAGGDILVLRASGSNGYNTYMYSQLGITVNSVESIVFNNASAASDPYVLSRIAQAEAIWFAGGDQWDYVSYWRNTAVDSLINDGIQNRNIVIGGTSAGMAILGGLYFTAQNGSATSAAALINPYNSKVTVDSARFLDVPFLGNVITDTHYDNPDRRGRHVVFMARAWQDYGIDPIGIACDEYTAVCIDQNGIAKVYGDYPAYDENAWFIRPNCELSDPGPENCTAGQSLHWYRDSVALIVCNIKGTNTGANTFDLNQWTTVGGTWQHWWVDQGTLKTQPAAAPNCGPIGISIPTEPDRCIRLIRNMEEYILESDGCTPERIQLFSLQGQLLQSWNPAKSLRFSLNRFPKGVFFLRVISEGRIQCFQILW